MMILRQLNGGGGRWNRMIEGGRMKSGRGQWENAELVSDSEVSLHDKNNATSARRNGGAWHCLLSTPSMVPSRNSLLPIVKRGREIDDVLPSLSLFSSHSLSIPCFHPSPLRHSDQCTA